MKKIILITLLAGSAAQAQWAPNHAAALESIKSARKQLETNTENQILEKLEAARLEDEKNRRQKFEGLNFSVVNDGAPNSTNTVPTTTNF